MVSGDFNPIRAVIFDMDGVLIDSEPIQHRLETVLFSELGFKLSETEHKAFLGINNFEMVSSLKARFGFAESIDQIVSEIRQRYLLELSSNGIPMIEGVTPLIDSLVSAGFKLAVASSAPKEQIDLVMKSSGLGHNFPVQVSGDEVDKSKPEPAIFLKAANLLQVGTSECCVIEDSINGVTAAKSAGMRCLGFRNPESSENSLEDADWIVDSMNDAGKIIIPHRYYRPSISL